MRSAAGTAAEQLNDGPLADADFLKHARAQRKLPGEGELDVVGLIRAVQATGFRAVLRRGEHPGIRALPVGEAARRAADACRRGAVHGVGVIVGRHLARSNGDSLIVRPASGSPPRQPGQIDNPPRPPNRTRWVRQRTYSAEMTGSISGSASGAVARLRRSARYAPPGPIKKASSRARGGPRKAVVRARHGFEHRAKRLDRGSPALQAEEPDHGDQGDQPPAGPRACSSRVNASAAVLTAGPIRRTSSLPFQPETDMAATGCPSGPKMGLAAQLTP